MDLFLRAKLPQEAPNELAADQFLDTSSCNLQSLLNFSDVPDATLTQQTTRAVSLGYLAVTVRL